MVLKKRPSKITVCYLCGRPLDAEPADKDHVPPDRWIAKQFKTPPGPQVLTLPAHVSCQHKYEGDEVYFFNTLLPLAAGSPAADAAMKDLGASFKYPEQKALAMKILNEFGRVITSDGKLLKSYLPARVNRILWKVVRGLFFVEYDGRLLPEDTPRMFEVIGPEETSTKLPPEFTLVRDTPSRGRYPGAFDYKYLVVEDADHPAFKLHYWAMILWDRVVAIVAFHDPDCDCEQCKSTAAGVDGAGSASETNS